MAALPQPRVKGQTREVKGEVGALDDGRVVGALRPAFGVRLVEATWVGRRVRRRPSCLIAVDDWRIKVVERDVDKGRLGCVLARSEGRAHGRAARTSTREGVGGLCSARSREDDRIACQRLEPDDQSASEERRGGRRTDEQEAKEERGCRGQGTADSPAGRALLPLQPRRPPAPACCACGGGGGPACSPPEVGFALAASRLSEPASSSSRLRSRPSSAERQLSTRADAVLSPLGCVSALPSRPHPRLTGVAPIRLTITPPSCPPCSLLHLPPSPLRPASPNSKGPSQPEPGRPTPPSLNPLPRPPHLSQHPRPRVTTAPSAMPSLVHPHALPHALRPDLLPDPIARTGTPLSRSASPSPRDPATTAAGGGGPTGHPASAPPSTSASHHHQAHPHPQQQQQLHHPLPQLYPAHAHANVLPPVPTFLNAAAPSRQPPSPASAMSSGPTSPSPPTTPTPYSSAGGARSSQLPPSLAGTVDASPVEIGLRGTDDREGVHQGSDGKAGVDGLAYAPGWVDSHEVLDVKGATKVRAISADDVRTVASPSPLYLIAKRHQTSR